MNCPTRPTRPTASSLPLWVAESFGRLCLFGLILDLAFGWWNRTSTGLVGRGSRVRSPPPLPSIFLMDGHLTKTRGGKKGQIRPMIRFCVFFSDTGDIRICEIRHSMDSSSAFRAGDGQCLNRTSVIPRLSAWRSRQKMGEATIVPEFPLIACRSRLKASQLSPDTCKTHSQASFVLNSCIPLRTRRDSRQARQHSVRGRSPHSID